MLQGLDSRRSGSSRISPATVESDGSLDSITDITLVDEDQSPALQQTTMSQPYHHEDSTITNSTSFISPTSNSNGYSKEMDKVTGHSSHLSHHHHNYPDKSQPDPSRLSATEKGLLERNRGSRSCKLLLVIGLLAALLITIMAAAITAFYLAG